MYQNLSDKELLSALIMEQGHQGLAEKLLHEFPSLPYLFIDSSVEELQQVKGIGEKRALQLKACYEIVRRLQSYEVNKDAIIKSPADVVRLVGFEMRYLRKEQFKALLLNVKNKVIENKLITEGTLNSSLVHPREVFAHAIKRAASSLVLLHNHPSGDPEPSSEDIQTTARLVSAGELLGIKITDHIIIGAGQHVSFRERGLIQ